MRYRSLPGTQLKVSEIGYKIGNLSGSAWDHFSSAQAGKLIHHSLDLGINIFDTADAYGNGRVESLLGEILADERDRVILATKFGYQVSAQPPKRTLGGMIKKKEVIRACEESLRRLGTDRIDIYELHHPTVAVIENEEIYKALQTLRKDGKILTWGACLGPGNGWTEEGKLLMRVRKAATIQIIYNLMEQEPGQEILDEVKRHKTSLMIRVPKPEGLEKMEGLKFLAQPKTRSITQAALQFALNDFSVASVLVDMETEAKIHEVAGTSECPELLPGEIRQIHEYYDIQTKTEVSSSSSPQRTHRHPRTGLGGDQK